MRLLSTFALFLSLFCASSWAAVITNGFPAADVQKAMAAAGYKQTGLDMVARNPPSEALESWNVDQGVLIVTYSTDSGRIVALSYFLCDERAKATRKTFDLEVVAFDTTSGLMTVKTHKAERSGPAKATHPIRSETNSTSSAAGSRR